MTSYFYRAEAYIDDKPGVAGIFDGIVEARQNATARESYEKVIEGTKKSLAEQNGIKPSSVRVKMLEFRTL